MNRCISPYNNWDHHDTTQIYRLLCGLCQINIINQAYSDHYDNRKHIHIERNNHNDVYLIMNSGMFDKFGQYQYIRFNYYPLNPCPLVAYKTGDVTAGSNLNLAQPYLEKYSVYKNKKLRITNDIIYNHEIFANKQQAAKEIMQKIIQRNGSGYVSINNLQCIKIEVPRQYLDEAFYGIYIEPTGYWNELRQPINTTDVLALTLRYNSKIHYWYYEIQSVLTNYVAYSQHNILYFAR